MSIPYTPDFVRTKAYYSRLCLGASLKALCVLAENKCYYFIGSDGGGENAFFVGKDVIGNLKPLTCEQGFIKSKVRESLDENGRHSFVEGDQHVKLIEEMQVVDVLSGK